MCGGLGGGTRPATPVSNWVGLITHGCPQAHTDTESGIFEYDQVTEHEDVPREVLKPIQPSCLWCRWIRPKPPSLLHSFPSRSSRSSPSPPLSPSSILHLPFLFLRPTTPAAYHWRPITRGWD